MTKQALLVKALANAKLELRPAPTQGMTMRAHKSQTMHAARLAASLESLATEPQEKTVDRECTPTQEMPKESMPPAVSAHALMDLMAREDTPTNAAVVGWLVKQTAIPWTSVGQALVEACKSGKHHYVRALLAQCTYHPKDLHAGLVAAAAAVSAGQGQAVACVQLLCSEPLMQYKDMYAVSAAYMHDFGRCGIPLQACLAKVSCDSGTDGTLKGHAMFGDLVAFKSMLRALPDAHHGWERQVVPCLQLAAEAGHAALVDFILGFLLVTEKMCSQALLAAAQHGHEQVVKVLLEFMLIHGMDPHADNRAAQKAAMLAGHTSVATRLANIAESRA